MDDDPTDIFNWRRIDERLTTSGQPGEGQLVALKEIGVTHVVNLALHTHEKALADEAGSLRALGLEYVHIPVAFDDPTEADFMRFCAVMRELAGEVVHVHCIFNFRVSAFLYRYFRDELGLVEGQARAVLERVWRPGGVWARFIGDAEGEGLAHRYAGRDYEGGGSRIILFRLSCGADSNGGIFCRVAGAGIHMRLVRALYGVSGRLTFWSFLGILLLDFIIFCAMLGFAAARDNKSRTGSAHEVATIWMLVAVLVLVWALTSLLVRSINSLRFYLWGKKNGYLGGKTRRSGSADSETQKVAARPIATAFADNHSREQAERNFQTECERLVRSIADGSVEDVRKIRTEDWSHTELPGFKLESRRFKVIGITAAVLIGFLFGMGEVAHVFPRSDGGAGGVIIFVSLFGFLVAMKLLRLRLYVFEEGFGIRSYFTTKFYRWADVYGVFEFVPARYSRGFKVDAYVRFKMKPVTIAERLVQPPEHQTIDGSLDISAHDLMEIMNIYLVRADGTEAAQMPLPTNPSISPLVLQHIGENTHQAGAVKGRAPAMTIVGWLLMPLLLPFPAWLFYNAYLSDVCPKLPDLTTGHTVYLYVSLRYGHAIAYVTPVQYQIHHVLSLALTWEVVAFCILILVGMWKKMQDD